MSVIGIKKAIIINFISRYSNIFIQLILNAILARLLEPSDYGVVAIITVFINFFTMIADMGIGPAIIQNKDLSEDDLVSIFSYTIIIAIFISGLFILFSIPLSFFYNNKVYIKLGLVLSISIIFSVLNMVPNSLMLKEKKFKIIGLRTVIITVFSGLITIVLAFIGFKYYAIVINSVISSLLTFILNYRTCGLKRKLSFNKDSINKIKNFSKFQFGFNLVNYFSRNLDNLLIGKFIGSESLGYYDKAYKLMLYPVQNLTNLLTSVLHPFFADYQKNKDKIYDQYIKVIKFLSLSGIYITVYCFFSSREIISIVFGANWDKSIPAFKILSLSIVVQVVLSSTGTIFQATNETKKLFICGLITSSINIFTIITTVLLKKIEFIALGIVVAYILNFFIVYYLLIIKVFEKSIGAFLHNFISTMVICFLCSFSLYIFNFNIKNIVLSALFKLIICTVSYILGLFVTGEHKFFINHLKRK